MIFNCISNPIHSNICKKFSLNENKFKLQLL